jgi:hypothetical protein
MYNFLRRMGEDFFCDAAVFTTGPLSNLHFTSGEVTAHVVAILVRLYDECHFFPPGCTRSSWETLVSLISVRSQLP